MCEVGPPCKHGGASSPALIRTCGAQRSSCPAGPSSSAGNHEEDGDMETSENKPTRKGSNPIKVYCLPEERAAIETNARRAGHSASTYLRLVGQGY